MGIGITNGPAAVAALFSVRMRIDCSEWFDFVVSFCCKCKIERERSLVCL